MAESHSHKFGQIIGDMIEASIEPMFFGFAESHNLYLDKKGPRYARSGKKVTWVDKLGNNHDLDYVLEKDGSETKIGTPVAFIEIAWRRYTKHSRNKAQEIQGAILPLVLTHQKVAPFYGAILAGVFTSGALTQLVSQGFTTLYFPYETVVAAFENVGIDARFDEHTLEADLSKKVDEWNKLYDGKRKLVHEKLVELNSKEIKIFMEKLDKTVKRQIKLVLLIPLHGKLFECPSIEKAVDFIENYNESNDSNPVLRYEVEIRYNNGDKITGIFADKDTTIDFLRSYEPIMSQPANDTLPSQRSLLSF